MAQASTYAEKFAQALTNKFKSDDFASTLQAGYSFEVRPGRKYDKIISLRPSKSISSKSIFAYVDRSNGDLYKPSGKTPAKGVRYPGEVLLTRAVDEADPYGGFLYVC